MELDEQAFIDEIAPARTFGFLKEVEMLRQRGLALGGSLENAVVLGETGVSNPLRFEDEFVRHKILDVVGDLALVGLRDLRAIWSCTAAAMRCTRPLPKKCCVSATPGSSSSCRRPKCCPRRRSRVPAHARSIAS